MKRSIAKKIAMGAVRALVALSVTPLPALAAGPPPAQGAGKKLEKVEPLPERPAAEIIGAMRVLSELQQRTVTGDRAAVAQQTPAAVTIKTQLLATPASVWSVKHARLALIKHVLSGGDTTVLNGLLDQKQVQADELDLARGAVAYAGGDRDEAAEHLARVDLQTLPAGLGGHVALIRAILVSDADRKAALALTDEARILSPGTVVEETALRLAIELSIADGDSKRFEQSIMRYLLRFPASLYAETIYTRVAGVSTLSDRVAGHGGKHFLMALGDALAPARRRTFYAKIAEAALRGGKFGAAEVAASLARGGVPARDAITAHLVAIEAAALMVGSRRSEALKLIDSAGNSEKSEETAKLLAASRALARMIDEPPQPPGDSPTTEPETKSQSPSAPATNPKSTALELKFESLSTRALSSLSTADKLLAEALQ